jgi:hypothetical protein
MASFSNQEQVLRRGSVAVDVQNTDFGTLYTVNKTNQKMTPINVLNRLERVFEHDNDPLQQMYQGPNSGVKWRIVRMGSNNELIGALCPWNEMTSLKHIGGGQNTTALQQLPLFLNGRSVIFDAKKDAIHVATDQSIKAMFDARTTNSETYRVWELPTKPAPAAKQQWAPSSTKFDGRTTSGEQYKAYDYTPTRASRPPQVAAVSDAPFDGRTTNSEQFKQWELPEQQKQVAPREWTPSNTKFDGRTTSGTQFKAYDLTSNFDNPVRVVIDHSTIRS